MTAITQQQMFDKVAKALLKQNKKSHVVRDCIPQCVYETDSGLRCAIGHMLNATGINTIKRWKANTTPLDGMLKIFTPNESEGIAFIHANKDFCFSMQKVHDKNDPPHWRMALRDVARTYELDDRITYEN